MAPHREDFIRWREDPVTRWVAEAFTACADECRDTWIGASWNNGAASPQMLAELRVRSDAYLALRDSTYEAFCGMLGEQPRDE